MGEPRKLNRRISSHASAEMRAAIELLSDGEWHDYEAVVEKIGRVVTPSRALRMNETVRAEHYSKHGEEIRPRTREIDVDSAIIFGKREYARRALRHDWFEKNPKGRILDGQHKYIRIKPEHFEGS